MSNSVLIDRVRELIEKHGGVRAAARVLEINFAYLWRLQSGAKSNPRPAVLRKLGLRKVVIFERVKP